MLTDMMRQTTMHITCGRAVDVDRVLVELHNSFAMASNNLTIIAQFAPAPCLGNDTAPPRMSGATNLN